MPNINVIFFYSFSTFSSYFINLFFFFFNPIWSWGIYGINLGTTLYYHHTDESIFNFRLIFGIYDVITISFRNKYKTVTYVKLQPFSFQRVKTELKKVWQNSSNQISRNQYFNKTFYKFCQKMMTSAIIFPFYSILEMNTVFSEGFQHVLYVCKVSFYNSMSVWSQLGSYMGDSQIGWRKIPGQIGVKVL